MSTDNAEKNNTETEQHTLVKSLMLHLLPGFVISLIYIVIVPSMNKLGIPPFLVLMGLAALLLIPFELGYLFYLAKKKHGSFSLKSIIYYRRRTPVWQIILLTIILLAWGYFVLLVIFRPLGKPIIDTFFSWVPEIYFFETFMSQLDQYPKSILIFTSILGIFINGVFGPIVEELYFRGFLLPGISRFKGWSPLLNTALFALYHFFTPWQNPMRLVAFLPMCYTVWWKKNITVGIFVHCIMNLIGTIGMLLAILNLN